MNFVQRFKQGQEGKSLGLNTGLPHLDDAIYGIQRGYIYGVAAPPKVGKTALTDFCFLVQPYMQSLRDGTNVEWIYFSFEIDRVRKEFRIAALFFYIDYGIYQFEYNGRTYKMDNNYLMGRLKDQDGNLIPVSEEHENILKVIYTTRIIPLFGEYDEQGRCIKRGKILFVETKVNPTGIHKFLWQYAEANGEFINVGSIHETIKSEGERKYIPNDPDKYTIIITDHIRKLRSEERLNLKQTVDRYISYTVDFRDLCRFTFVHIVHLNRNFVNSERFKHKEYLYPTGEDVKETGNLSEDCDVMLTMFNPADEKYGIDTHFGIPVRNYPGYRSIHVVESRDGECPLHLACQYHGNVNLFTKLQQNS